MIKFLTDRLTELEKGMKAIKDLRSKSNSNECFSFWMSEADKKMIKTDESLNKLAGIQKYVQKLNAYYEEADLGYVEMQNSIQGSIVIIFYLYLRSTTLLTTTFATTLRHGIEEAQSVDSYLEMWYYNLSHLEVWIDASKDFFEENFFKPQY